MTAYYNEFDPGAAAWLRELIRRGLIADGEVDERSILDVTADDLRGFTQCHFFAGIGGGAYALRLAGFLDDRPVWTGSPPCQPFSTAGQQKGQDDERHLAPHFASLVAAGRPPILFGEQVASAAVFGKVTRKARSQSEGEPEWAWIDDLQDRLEAAHYAVGASDIPAAGVGAPHIRQRTFFGAVRLGNAPDVCGRARADHRGLGGTECPLDCEARQGDGQATGTASGAVRLADADSQRHDRIDSLLQRQEPGRDEQDSVEASRSGKTSRVADANDKGPQGRPGMSQRPDQRPSGENGVVDEGRPCPLDEFWRDADWLFCRDGKWRPVEPGTFPLAHGIPARVVRLRGYGNAIVPQAAAQFVRAFLDATS